ncbi:MAG: type II toxin-antitoxin system VapC family toxin [Chloroflexota bacterium]
MSAAPVFLDVNVPMYAAGEPHAYKEACLWVLTEIAAGRISAAIDTEAIQEILYRYGAQQRWELAVAVANELLIAVPAVYPVDTTDIRLAIQLFQQYAPQGVKARDLIHAAVMQNNGLTEIISTDAHFDRIEGITRMDPLRLFREAQAKRDSSPDGETVERRGDMG